MPTTDELERQKQTAEMIRQRKMQEDFGDIEFQMEIAPLLGYVGEIDPKLARYHGIGGSDAEVTTKGFYVPPEDPNDPNTKENLRPYRVNVEGYRGEIPKEPGTINVVGAKSATPEIWAHEYRHKQYPEMSERDNRLADASSAMNESQWESAIDFWRDYLRRQGSKVTRSEAEKSLLNKLSNRTMFNQTYLNELKDKGANLPESKKTYLQTDTADYQNMRESQVYWPKRKAELDEFDSWVQELEERNAERSGGK